MREWQARSASRRRTGPGKTCPAPAAGVARSRSPSLLQVHACLLVQVLLGARTHERVDVEEEDA